MTDRWQGCIWFVTVWEDLSWNSSVGIWKGEMWEVCPHPSLSLFSLRLPAWCCFSGLERKGTGAGKKYTGRKGCVTIQQPLSHEVFWHEYAKIPRHTSKNAITEGDFKCNFCCTCEDTEQLQGYNKRNGYLPQIAGIGFAEGITSEKRFVKQETGRKRTTGQKGDSMEESYESFAGVYDLFMDNVI